MTRMLSSMLIGGVLFGSAFSQADSGERYGKYWPSSDATVVAQADPWQQASPDVPAPPRAPRAGSGVSVQIHDGKVQIDGVSDLVDNAIRSAQDEIKTSGLPADVRDKLQKHLDKVRETVKNRLSHLDAKDLDQLGEELGKMGDDIG